MNRFVATAIIIVVLVGSVFASPPSRASTAEARWAGIAIPGYRLASASQAQLETDLDRLVATGTTWLRTDIVWGDIEYIKGRFNWSYSDRIVAAAYRRGLKIVGIATVLPAWARPSGTSWNHGPTTSAQRNAFAHFARLAAARYAGRINAWEIWNEPNLKQFWAPRPSARDYAALLRSTYPAIKAANRSAVVMTGGTGWATGSPNIRSTDWYKSLYAQNARRYFDAAAVHPYFDFSGVLSQEMARARSIRAVMDAAGDKAKPLWGTETGAPTGGHVSLSEAKQATLLSQAYDTWARIHDHGPLFWYTLNDTGGQDREAFFGLVRGNGTLKPSFRTLQSYLARHPQ
jgi:hypothetical protein